APRRGRAGDGREGVRACNGPSSVPVARPDDSTRPRTLEPSGTSPSERPLDCPAPPGVRAGSPADHRCAPARWQRTTMHAFPPDAPAMSTPPPYLDDAQIERLAELLEQRAVPFKGFNLEALDGFLSALVVSPSTVLPSEWQPLVWGDK